ncbi:hypothetical protein BDZ88DRAFT_263737 [Geranomyces variabilis]|nr:hypothetical protein BDZ88DRAFT_263737 [Geranomyces variabilis]
MSRLIVKNLPKHYNIDRFREHFGQKGEITDVKLAKTPDGTFRRFGYVGYKTDKEAKAALKFFDGTFVDTSRIQVELAKSIGDNSLARPWSRHSSGSSAFDRKQNAELDAQRKRDERTERLRRQKEETNQEMERKKKLLGTLYAPEAEDPKLKEFLDVMRPRAAARNRTWANDDVTATAAAEESRPKVNAKVVAVANRKTGGDGMLVTKTHVTFGDSDDELYDELPAAGKAAGKADSKTKDSKKAVAEVEEEKDEQLPDGPAHDSGMSDLDYLKSKMKALKDDAEEEEEDVEEEAEPTLEDDDENALAVDPVPSADVGTTPEATSAGPDDLTPAEPPADGTAPSGLLKDTQPDLPPPRVWVAEPVPADVIADTGRLFVKNLAYSCTVEDLHKLFEKFGPLTEVHIPIDKETKKPKGYAFVLYLLPEHAVRAFTTLDGTIFQGRILDVQPGRDRPKAAEEDDSNNKEQSFKNQKERKRKADANNEFSWNSLFMNSDAVAEAMAKKLGVRKSDILNPEAENMAVRLALAETHVIAETKKHLESEGIDLSAFERCKTRSKTVILVKNIPHDTNEEDLIEVFGKFGDLGRLVLPPARTIALVEFRHLNEAKSAFQRLAYTKFKHLPLYLEWAPVDTFKTEYDPARIAEEKAKKAAAEAAAAAQPSATGTVSLPIPGAESDDDEPDKAALDPLAKPKNDAETTDAAVEDPDAMPVATLFVKNLSFDTTEAGLQEAFGGLRGLRSARVATKPDRKTPGGKLSMGFGFLEFEGKEHAVACMKAMQNFSLDGHVLQLKFSNAAGKSAQPASRKRAGEDKVEVTGTKLIVRNIPFEATKKDLRQLFSSFGQLKSVRIPTKMDGQHRGFGFVDFLTKQEAKAAFESLAATHLYGRHLVLEWAQDETSVEAMRTKTAKGFFGDEGGPPKRRKLVLEGDDEDRMDED